MSIETCEKRSVSKHSIYLSILVQRVNVGLECILKAQVPGVSMRPPLCTDAHDLLCCSATVGNLGERGEPDILTKVRHWDLLCALSLDRPKVPGLIPDQHSFHAVRIHA